MTRSLFLALSLVAVSASASTAGYTYQARIDGMVCAFCAYNVAKSIGALPSVDAETVTVDLEAKRASFHSTLEVNRQALSAAFAGSGFTLSEMHLVDSPQPPTTTYQSAPVIELDLDGADTVKFENLLKAMGEFASVQKLRLVLEAPESIEIELLMPILMGRDHSLNVNFLPIEEDVIRLKMYPQALTVAQ